MSTNFLAKVRGNFIAGVIVILPAAVTLWLLTAVYKAISKAVLNPLIIFFEPYLYNIFLEFTARATVFIALILLVVFIGAGTRILFLKKLFSTGEKIFFKIPMLGKVYVTIKQMSRAFLGERKGVFITPVLVEYPRKGVYSIGFLTSDSRGEIQEKTGKKLVNIFIPTTPNPTSGMLLLTPEDEIINLNMSVEEAMKLVISGGIVSPGEIAPETSKDFR